MTDCELLELFYKLGGIAWNVDIRRAVFTDRESAKEFKYFAPNWTVLFAVEVQ